MYNISYACLSDFWCVFEQVDPSLVGGMTVTIGDKFIDMSLKSKIKLYTDILKSASI